MEGLGKSDMRTVNVPGGQKPETDARSSTVIWIWSSKVREVGRSNLADDRRSSNHEHDAVMEARHTRVARIRECLASPMTERLVPG